MFCGKCGNEIKAMSNFCSKCGNKINYSVISHKADNSNPNKSIAVAKRFPIKRIIIISAILLIIVALISIILSSRYTIEMDYTERNIKHFIRGIKSHADNLEIEINNIEIDDYIGEYATASIYVRYTGEDNNYSAEDITLAFTYGHDGWNENGYEVEVFYNGWNDRSGIFLVMKVAEAIELMLTGNTSIENIYNHHIRGDKENIKYSLGKYSCLCNFWYIGGDDNMHYTITTHKIR